MTDFARDLIQAHQSMVRLRPKPRRIPSSVTLDLDLVERVEALASSFGLSRGRMIERLIEEGVGRLDGIDPSSVENGPPDPFMECLILFMEKRRHFVGTATSLLAAINGEFRRNPEWCKIHDYVHGHGDRFVDHSFYFEGSAQDGLFDGENWYFSPRAFKKVCPGVVGEVLARKLWDAGILLRSGEERCFTHKITTAGGRFRFYKINAGLLTDKIMRSPHDTGGEWPLKAQSVGTRLQRNHDLLAKRGVLFWRSRKDEREITINFSAPAEPRNPMPGGLRS